MAQLKSTVVQGALTVTGNVVANKLIKLGGTDDQILMADGTTSSKSEILSKINAAVTLKGTLGTGGTITSLPAASVSNLGYGYKVITVGTYNSVAAKVGDMFICYKNGDSYEWMHIPSGDDIEDTWRPIQIDGDPFLTNGNSGPSLNLVVGDNLIYTYVSSTGSLRLDAKDTTYAADRGLRVWNNTFGHAKTITPSATEKKLYKIAYDEYGHITGADAITLPSVSGFVTGPSDSTDNAIARFDLTTGKLIQNSTVTIDDSGNTTLPTNATLKLNTYGTRFLTLSGNSITADMSNETGGWAGSFAGVKDPSGTTTTMLGWLGGSTLTHIYMGGAYNDPYMKMTADGLFTFKKQVTINAAQGTAPLNVTSTTVNTNLNADLLDGKHASAFALTSDIPSVSGFVTGPNSSTDNAIARYHSTTGKVIQNSRATIDDTGNLKINNSDGGDIGLILGRGSNADWRLLGSNGNFYIQGNYTTSKQTSFYSVLTLAYNSGNATVKGSVTANGFKHSNSTTGTDNYVLLAGGGTKAVSDFQAAGNYLPKTTYEWNKEYAANSNGAVSLGRYKLYDTQLTFDITTTTSTTLSGKLVIAAQNGKILKATVYGDASNTLVGYLTIYQSAIASDSTSWIEVFCNFPGWSKNKVHIYGVDLASGDVTRQMASVTFTNGVPSGVTSGDTKWTGTIVNDIDARGFVAGPSESTDNAVVRFDGATGKVIQNSGVTIDDNNKLKINANDTGGQSNVFQALSTSASTNTGTWIGRSIMGSKTLTFLMGTYKNMAAVGAHSWTDANAGSGAAWAPVYFQPDGGASAAIYMGQNGVGWTANTGTLIIKGSGTANAGTVDVNGTFTATTIKKKDGADTHVLLAGGGTKALSDFSTSDTKVTQSDTTTANWRKVVLSYQNNATAGTATTSHTNQVYVTPNIEVQPSTGNVRIAGSIYEGGTALSSKYAAKTHTHTKSEITDFPSIPNPTNYYWANVKVSGSSSTATTPSVQKLGITGSTTTTASAAVTMEYDSTYKALKFVFA